MIATLTGTVTGRSADRVVIDVHGVGYLVFVSAQTAESLPADMASVTLQIHTHVREDQIALFGFTTVAERTLFQRLLSVSSVGPKLALAVLSKLAPHELVHAVAGEDLVRLAAIPGIGKKTAERIVVDLKDRLMRDHADLLHTAPGAAKNGGPIRDQAISALCNLGYSRVAAERALAGLQPADGASLEVLLRTALRELARVQ